MWFRKDQFLSGHRDNATFHRTPGLKHGYGLAEQPVKPYNTTFRVLEFVVEAGQTP